jgi:hypothetical protein
MGKIRLLWQGVCPSRALWKVFCGSKIDVELWINRAVEFICVK